MAGSPASPRDSSFPSTPFVFFVAISSKLVASRYSSAPPVAPVLGRTEERGRGVGKLVDDGTDGLTARIIGAAINVHREFGPGLFESTYDKCLAAELRHMGLRVDTQVAVPLLYRDIRVDLAYRMDMVVENSVVVELKAVEKLAPVHVSQVLTYLRLSGLRVGLLFNFNVPALVAGGFRRVLFDGTDCHEVLEDDEEHEEKI